MHQVRDELLRLDDSLLAKTQQRINTIFNLDLLAPIYCVYEPAADGTIAASIVGHDVSCFYHDRIANWTEPGFLLRFHWDKMPRDVFHATVLHEIAHAMQIEMALPCYLPPSERTPERKTQATQPVLTSRYNNYFWHRIDFWRIVCHVWSRGVKTGFPCDHRHLGLSWVDAGRMLETLTPEIEQLADLQLWKIGRRPVPRTFARLFDFDPQDWNDEQVIAKALEYHLTPKEEHA